VECNELKWCRPELEPGIDCLAGVVHTSLGEFAEGDGLLEELADLELPRRPRALAQNVAFATIGKPLLTLLAKKPISDLAGSGGCSPAGEHYGIRILARRVAGHLV
jgi:hypothetical protein